jgi:hypothetical protein
MLRWSREVAVKGADAAWPSAKGLELDKASDAIEWC